MVTDAPFLTRPGRATGVPPPRQAHRRHLQPGLRVLLLPLEGDAVSGQPVPDGRPPPRDLPSPAHRGARAFARGDGRLAGRGTDDDGSGLLPPVRAARREASDAAPADRVHDPDERHPDRRGVGGVLQGERLPRRRLDRRPEGDPRHVPRRQGREGEFRPGDGEPRAPPGRRGRVERPHHDPRGEPEARARHLPVPAGRVRRAVHAVHPDRRTGDAPDPPDRERRLGRGRGGTTALHAGG